MPVMAVKMLPANEEQRYLLARSGYGDDPLIVVWPMSAGGQATYDPYDWGGARTMHVAHLHIQSNFDAMKDGDVVCVEHILGEREAPKTSERLLP